MQLHVEPLTLLQANECVEKYHRHHGKKVGHRFSVGLFDEDGNLHGAAIVDRPASTGTEQYHIAEVARLVTDGTPNACSILYQACARAAKAMGFWRIQTFILASEPGTSLKASGWELDHRTLKGGSFNEGVGRGRRKVNTDLKVMWKRELIRRLSSAPIYSMDATGAKSGPRPGNGTGNGRAALWPSAVLPGSRRVHIR